MQNGFSDLQRFISQPQCIFLACNGAFPERNAYFLSATTHSLSATFHFLPEVEHFRGAGSFSSRQRFISLPQCIFLPARVHFLSATFLFLSEGGYFRSAEGFSWLHGFISLPQGLFLVCKGVFSLYALAFPGWTGLFPGHSKLFFAMVVHFPAYKPLFLSLCDRFRDRFIKCVKS